MKPLRSLLAPIAAVTLSLGLTGCATSPTDQHKGHHPDGAASGQAKMGAMSGSMPMTGMESNTMETCTRMMNAKTPDERKAMMDEHMKSMSPEMREKCMEMMRKNMGSHLPAK